MPIPPIFHVFRQNNDLTWWRGTMGGAPSADRRVSEYWYTELSVNPTRPRYEALWARAQVQGLVNPNPTNPAVCGVTHLLSCQRLVHSRLHDVTHSIVCSLLCRMYVETRHSLRRYEMRRRPIFKVYIKYSLQFYLVGITFKN